MNTINENWNMYIGESPTIVPGSIQHSEMRKAFIAGSVYMFEMITNLDHKSEEEAVAKLQVIYEDLKEMIGDYLPDKENTDG